MDLSNQPVKGTADWWPDEFAVRQYIFDTWREVCRSFGYRQYLTPLVEEADLYRAKSGEDVGGAELTVFTDRGGRELAIRPEMTPSVTRMVSRKYKAMPKPVRLFSIANFFRNQSPQRGRNREFWQLNYDIFGSHSLGADIEILQMALEIMLSFEPPEESFVVYVNDRRLIDVLLDEIGLTGDNQRRTEVIRVLDKWEKIGGEVFEKRLADLDLEHSQIWQLSDFMSRSGEMTEVSDYEKLFSPELKAFGEISKVIELLNKMGYGSWVEFRPSLVRGFDYYDGMVFEVFDRHPKNNRSLFGGGRYDALAGLFGMANMPAVGCAPGDETIRLFLESWDLLGNSDWSGDRVRVYLPLIESELRAEVLRLARELRVRGWLVETALEEQRLSAALEYADKAGFDKVVLFGPEEVAEGCYQVRDMEAGRQEKVDLPAGTALDNGERALREKVEKET